MKALTICQPYAALIVAGEKLVENRTWPTNYRGVLAIHAGKSRAWLAPNTERWYADNGEPLVFGAVVGVAELVAVLDYGKIQRGHYDPEYSWVINHKHASGPWCWILRGAEPIDPVQINGKQGLWNLPYETLKTAQEQAP
jgi:hypothetical protein